MIPLEKAVLMSKKQSKAAQQAGAQRAAERAAAVRREQETKERRRRTLVLGAVVLGVIALIVAIAVAVQASRDTTGTAATPPAGAVDTYGIPLGAADAPVTIEIYEDFMCPFCGQFEAAAGDIVKEYADSGEVQVQYKVIAFLDSASDGSDYSTRAMNAVAVVLEEAGPEAAVEMHDLLFANQPKEGAKGLDDQQLVDLAVEAGASANDVADPIKNLRFEQWVKNATDDFSKQGYTSTPTVVVDGEEVDFETINGLLAEVEQAVDSALAEQ